jgi:hypothetical protein
VRVAVSDYAAAMSQDARIGLSVDRRTAELLRDVLYELGEHQAAGAPIPQTTPDDSELLGALLRELDLKLGGTGRLA